MRTQSAGMFSLRGRLLGPTLGMLFGLFFHTARGAGDVVKLRPWWWRGAVVVVVVVVVVALGVHVHAHAHIGLDIDIGMDSDL